MVERIALGDCGSESLARKFRFAQPSMNNPAQVQRISLTPRILAFPLDRTIQCFARLNTGRL